VLAVLAVTIRRKAPTELILFFLPLLLPEAVVEVLEMERRGIQEEMGEAEEALVMVPVDWAIRQALPLHKETTEGLLIAALQIINCQEVGALVKMVFLVP
jgi:hypothetical protein